MGATTVAKVEKRTSNCGNVSYICSWLFRHKFVNNLAAQLVTPVSYGYAERRAWTAYTSFSGIQEG